MPEKSLQFKDTDGSLYIFDLDKESWIVVNDVKKLPSSIRKQVHDYLTDTETAVENAEKLKRTL
jgi:hypothetical protein